MDFNNRWLELHGNPKLSKVIKGWLMVSKALARNARWLSPNFITSLSILASFIYFLNYANWYGLIFFIFALILDGLDGAVAVYFAKETIFGGFYDSLADRISEFFWLWGIYLLLDKNGLAAGLTFTFWLLALGQEYLRARSAGLGAKSIGITTICERPVRALLLICFLAGHLLFTKYLSSAGWELTFAIPLLFQITSFIQLLNYYRILFKHQR
jgi:phosphatidylglycerophosphate synthase